MADVRGLPVTGAFVLGDFIAAAAAPAGYTSGKTYWPLALGIDCTPAPPVIYALVADDNGVIKTVPVTAFKWVESVPA